MTLRDPDRLYELLPAAHRKRDVARGEPLRALLQVISEQVNVLEDDMDQQYDNWFIETCEDWVVPYIGALIGYKAPPQVAAEGDMGAMLSSVLTPRRAVANSIRDRRRKGTLPLLELIAADTADWSARAVEFYRLLAWTQPLNHQRLSRGRTVNLRNGLALAHLGGPFDTIAHGVDVRRISATRTPGRHNIPNVGLFAWRLKPYTIAREPAYAREDLGSGLYTFSVLGNDAPLFALPLPETGEDAIAEPPNLPIQIGGRIFAQDTDTYYGPERSLAIWADDWPASGQSGIVPVDRIVTSDLSGWQYRPARDQVAVDPERGRIAFHPRQMPGGDVHVRYHYGFSDDIGGGPYLRNPVAPAGAVHYPVGSGAEFEDIASALASWREQDPDDAVIEITDGGVYTERLTVDLREGQSLQLRSRDESRAVLRLLDYRAARGDALVIRGAAGSRFKLDGMVVAGRGLQIRGPLAEFRLRDATLVPGWSLDSDCEPDRPTEPSLDLVDGPVSVSIENAILGAIQISLDEVGADPVAVSITDSIVDATSDTREAVGAPSWPLAHATLDIQRSTIIGTIQTHAIALAEDSIFTGRVQVARRQIGCIRFCHVPVGSRTPRRYRCQPDLAIQAALSTLPTTLVGGSVSVPVDIGGPPAGPFGVTPAAANLRLRLDTTKAAPGIGDPLTITLGIDNLGSRAATKIAITILPPQNAADPTQSAFASGSEVTVSRGALIDDSDPPIWELSGLAPGECAVLTAQLTAAAPADPPHLGAYISAYTFDDDTASYIDGLRRAAASEMRPVFTSRRYGMPGYCQLDLCTSTGIREGASDASEMGVFHNLFQPQRTAALKARLVDNVPAGMTAGLIFAN